MAFSSRLTLSLLLLLLAVCHGHAAPRAAPAPAVDCSSLILNMADCLSYVSNDSKTEKPEGSCCTGLKTVLKADASCLCEAFKSTGQMGIVLNMIKAMALPAACKVSAPSAANCGLAVAPAGAPVATLSPQNTPTTSSAAAPESSAAAPESSAAGGNVVAPAAAPASSACAMLFSSVTLLLGLSAASLPYF